MQFMIIGSFHKIQGYINFNILPITINIRRLRNNLSLQYFDNKSEEIKYGIGY